MGINLPQRGQPIDYSYIYQLVEQINSLSAELAKNKSANHIDNGKVAERVDKAGLAETKIVAKAYKLAAQTVNTVNDSISFDVSFDGSGFLYNPVVTITPQSSASQQASELDVYVVITNITTNNVQGYVQLNAGLKQKAEITLNILAVGIRR